jgi:hypothetical protein
MEHTQRTESYHVADPTGLGSRHGLGEAVSVTLDTSMFTPELHYPDGYFKSGIAIGRVTATGKYGPYSGTTEEVQLITVGGSGLTSFTLTYSGQTTASIDDQATAGDVQSALEGLSNIGVGDVKVSGDAGGPWTVLFQGALADTNVTQMTSTPTGGTGTVTVTTVTAGGAAGSSDGTDVLAGFLAFAVKAPDSTSIDVVGAMFDHCKVVNAKLPVPVDSAGRADVAGRIIFY